MANLETWAVVLFTGVLAYVEVRRLMADRMEKRLERVQRKIELAFEVNRWGASVLASSETDKLLHAAKAFREIVAVLDFPGDQVIENDVRQVLGKLMSRLQPPEAVDPSQPFEGVQERIRWGLMGWVEESEEIRAHPVRYWWRREVASIGRRLRPRRR